jgi:hypothetical protein
LSPEEQQAQVQLNMLTITHIVQVLRPYELQADSIEHCMSLPWKSLKVRLDAAIIEQENERRKARHAAWRSRNNVRATQRVETQEEEAMDIHDFSHFLNLPIDKEELELTRMYLRATGNAATRKKICAACAQRRFMSDCTLVGLDSIPCPEVLSPLHVAPGQFTYNNMLLEEDAVLREGSNISAWFCS